MYDPEYLLNLLEVEGIEEGIKKIDIEKIEDITIKVIFRTIAHSHEKIISYLKEVINNPTLLE